MLAFLSVLGLIVAIVAGSLSVYKFIEFRQHPAAWQPGLIFGLVALGMFVTALIVASIPSQPGVYGSGINVAQNSGNSHQGTDVTFTPVPSPTPTTTPSPTPTPLPKPNTVLYQADWTKGMNGWHGAAGWEVYNGTLLAVNVGNTSSLIGNAVIAPYQPETA